MGRYVIGVTGASGAIYADRLVSHLKDLGQEVHLVLTDMGKKVCAYEGFPDIAARADRVYDNKDFFAPISSGSYLHQGMAVVPCSMGTLGKIAHGIGDSLLTRAADVCLKEKRRLILVPRETPMSVLHLGNQKTLAEFGSVIIPANPSFYHRPAGIEDLVDTVLARVLDHLGLEQHRVGKRWKIPSMPIANALNPRHYLGLVRFSHTLFAMPFALASMVWAARGLPSPREFLLIVLCMVTCRNAAMAFNRLIDADIDKDNPRTARRHLPAGILSRRQVTAFLVLNAMVFLAATWFVNRLAFSLAVPALIAVCGYSVTKRFTSLSHYFLGLAIGISPVGAWIAVRGGFAWEPILLCLALLLWIGGFDIIYATQDHEFDRQRGLHSLVVRFGVKGALLISRFSHLAMWAVLAGLGWYGGLGASYAISLGVVAAMLVYLHLFRRSDSLDSMNQDFFLANIAVSLCVMAGIGACFRLPTRCFQ